MEEHLHMPASEETLGSDWLGRSFWRIAFKTSRLSNITKISFAFKPESSLNLTPTLYFELRFPIFITNGYDRKANACSPWTSCCFCVKRIMLWNCLCFYSSCFSVALSGISGNSVQKTILQTTEQLIQCTEQLIQC